MMFANNLFCLFRPCKQFFSIFFIPPLQKNNGPSLREFPSFFVSNVRLKKSELKYLAAKPKKV